MTPTTYRPRYRVEPYNGYSPEERAASSPIQNRAVRTGRMVHPTTCSVCGFSDPANPKGRGYIFAHLEDYRRPLETHPACKACHAALHARFSDPARWLRIARANYRPGAWFTLLTMDPASQTTAFDVTYPEGLPSAWSE
jgi:hypothetical protein